MLYEVITLADSRRLVRNRRTFRPGAARGTRFHGPAAVLYRRTIADLHRPDRTLV